MKAFLWVLLAGIAGYAPTMLAVPQFINYQGSLARPDGTPLDTTVAMTFKLWSASSAGTQYWAETDASVSVARGLFNVPLGQVTALPDSILNHSQLWLGVTVGGDSEMSPRVQLKSVAYSYRVGTIDGATAGGVSGDLFLNGRAALGPNVITGGNSFAAGYVNQAFGDYSSVSGGQFNIASGNGSHVGGGGYNRARGDYSVVDGGGGAFAYDSNSAIGANSVVACGYANTASGLATTVSGGYANTASGQFSTVSGGDNNTSAGIVATVSGGYFNTVSGNSASISGGAFNSASGDYAAIPGGFNCVANGDYSFVAGRNVKTNSNASGTFVWGDNDAADTLVSGIANRVVFRAANGYRLYTADNLSSGVLLNSGDGAWSSVSDSTKKRNRRNVDTKAILDKVSAMPIQRWSYKSQDPSIEHIGPMAQDFYAAFGLGDNNTTISTIDPDGVALAAIQELAKQVHELKNENQELRTQMQSMMAAQKQSQR